MQLCIFQKGKSMAWIEWLGRDLCAARAGGWFPTCAKEGGEREVHEVMGWSRAGFFRCSSCSFFPGSWMGVAGMVWGGLEALLAVEFFKPGKW
jgi:hypothetical protein